MVKIKGRITKIGNSYGLIIPKSLVDSEILRERELIEMELIDSEHLRKIANKYNERKEKDAVSGTWSRDYLARGLAGFPESML